MTSTMERTFEPPKTRAGRIRRIRTRIAAWTAVVVLAASALWATKEVVETCGSLGSGVHQVDGECVGVTDGSYLFDPEFEEIQRKITNENRRVRAEASSSVTVALLDLLTPTETTAKSVTNVRNELEGAYTAQRRINGAVQTGSSSPQIQLVLANWGSTEQQWQRVARQLVKLTEGDNPLVAVIGLGVSTKQTQMRAIDLSSDGVPMVGSLLTADELDYTRINGFIRVSPTTLDYAKALRDYATTRPDLRSAVMVYDLNSDSGGDLFTKWLRDNFDQQMSYLINGRPPLTFRGASGPSDANQVRFDLVTAGICAPAADIALYAGRRVDLGRFIDALAVRSCRNTPLTVITAADLGNLLSEREQQLSAGNLTVVHAGTSDAEGWGRGVEGTPEYYGAFLSAFRGHGFNEKNLVDGQAIQMHDALLTAAKAAQLATLGDSSPTAAKVRNVLLNLGGPHKVQGASGTLGFSSSPTGAGNPLGKPVPVLQFPSPLNDPFGQQVVTPPYVTQ